MVVFTEGEYRDTAHHLQCLRHGAERGWGARLFRVLSAGLPAAGPGRVRAAASATGPVPEPAGRAGWALCTTRRGRRRRRRVELDVQRRPLVVAESA